MASRKTASAGWDGGGQLGPPRFVGEHTFARVEHVEERLRSQQREFFQQSKIERCAGGEKGSARIEHGVRGLGGLQQRLAVLGVAGFLLQPRERLLQGLDVGQDEFGVDGLDVGERIDPAVHVDDIVVVEHPDHLTDRSASPMLARNSLSSPAPSLAPFTMPAMSRRRRWPEPS